MPNATVQVRNAISGYQQSTQTDATGNFRLTNIPANPYHIEVIREGFANYEGDVSIRSSVPIALKISLTVTGGQTTVNVEAGGADMVEVDPSAHVDADRSLLLKIPAVDPGAGLSQAITYSTGGVAADANGFFHPLRRPCANQLRDRRPAHQRPAEQNVLHPDPDLRLQSMELITGSPDAQYGDKIEPDR